MVIFYIFLFFCNLKCVISHFLSIIQNMKINMEKTYA